MSTKTGVAKSGSISRPITWDSVTGQSMRWSKSANGWVDNGKRSSLRDAEEAGARDIDRGRRSKGDFRKRG